MRRLVVALAVVTVLTAALSTAPAATSKPATTLVIKLRMVQTPGETTDVPPKGVLNRGDFAVIHHRLLNAAKQFGRPAGAVVGHQDAILTVLSKTRGSLSGRAILPNGTITFGGIGPVTSSARASSVPVTGGTGHYAQARGTLSRDSGAASALFTFRLRLP